ncbi:MAG: carboxymuconolactone decarboxylase family protein [Dehalococcoidia bacterium]|nr:carboxymuconolactone decarboxylase family protein [Dehalococcoidia bacterium]
MTDQPPIQLAAIVIRDGRFALFRANAEGAWSLPGGAFAAGTEDVDAAMDAILAAHGVSAPAIEDDFVQTVYLPLEAGGHALLNIYAPTEWTGDPAHPEGHERGWFGVNEIENLPMEERVRRAIFSAFGWEDETEEADLMRALAAGMEPFGALPATARDDDEMESLLMLEALEFGGMPGAAGESEPPERPRAESAGSRHDAGMDVLRTISGGDPVRAEAGLRRSSPELAGDIIDFALGEVWTHPALDRRTRSLQVVAMLAAMGGKSGPLRSHINGALNHGASAAQVVETLRMVAVYAGFPAALEAWPVMEDVFAARGIARPGRPA